MELQVHIGCLSTLEGLHEVTGSHRLLEHLRGGERESAYTELQGHATAAKAPYFELFEPKKWTAEAPLL